MQHQTTATATSARRHTPAPAFDPIAPETPEANSTRSALPQRDRPSAEMRRGQMRKIGYRPAARSTYDVEVKDLAASNSKVGLSNAVFFGTAVRVVGRHAQPVCDYAGSPPLGFGTGRCTGEQLRSRCLSRILSARFGATKIVLPPHTRLNKANHDRGP